MVISGLDSRINRTQNFACLSPFVSPPCLDSGPPGLTVLGLPGECINLCPSGTRPPSAAPRLSLFSLSLSLFPPVSLSRSPPSSSEALKCVTIVIHHLPN